MGRGVLFAAVFSVCLVLLFGVMLFLICTLEPPRIFMLNNTNYGRRDRRKFHNNIMLMHDAVLPIIENAQFGLGKIDTDEIDFYQSTSGPASKYNNMENITRKFRFTPRKIIPPLWPRPTQEIIIDPTMHIVLPPIWPTLGEQYSIPPRTTVPTTNNTNGTNVEVPKETTKPNTNKTIVKSMKRRSVDNIHTNENSGSVILKILDNEAKSRIEIKLGSDVLYKKQKSKGILSVIGKRSKLGVQSQIDDQRDSTNVAKDTIITIMPNDSIVIDEFDGKSVAERDHADIKQLISSLISIEGNDEESKEFPLYDDAIPHNIIFENKTLSFWNIVNNSSNYHIVNISNINDTTSAITTKNSIDIDSSTNTKINNTEFNKIIFSEEESNTEMNIVHKQANDTISIQNIVANDTDIENNENDNDLLGY